MNQQFPNEGRTMTTSQAPKPEKTPEERSLERIGTAVKRQVEKALSGQNLSVYDLGGIENELRQELLDVGEVVVARLKKATAERRQPEGPTTQAS